jgi:rubrerythrin
MEMYSFAKAIERKGAEYYRKLANETDLNEIKGVFEHLAVEEDNHYKIFEAMECGNATGIEGTANSAIEKAKNVFAALARGVQVPVTLKDSAAAYKKGLELENESIAYYRKARETAPDASQKKIIDMIIEQERSHARLMKSMIEFVNRPAQWLENAEWYHLDTY